MIFNHFNITAPKKVIEECVRFYTQVLGLENGYRPEFSRPGYWLYHAGKPILHLTIDDINDESVNSGDNNQLPYLNHIAFEVQNLSEFKTCLQDANICFVEKQVPNSNTKQLFFNDPVGNGLELVCY